MISLGIVGGLAFASIVFTLGALCGQRFVLVGAFAVCLMGWIAGGFWLFS